MLRAFELDFYFFLTSSFAVITPQKDDTGLFKASAVAPKKTEVKTSPASQLTKSKSGGGLFSDEDEEEGGGLFGASATKPQPKEEPKSRPKTKTTISLFDDDEQDEEEDFFAAPAVSKPAKNEPTKDKPKEEVKVTNLISFRSFSNFFVTGCCYRCLHSPMKKSKSQI